MSYYIRQHRKHVSGPHAVDNVRRWIKEGKVREEMEFSVDGTDWLLGIEMFDLFSREPARQRTPRRTGN